jgi:hypothetical protein
MVGKTFAEFLKERGTEEGNTTSLTLKDYREFLNSQGINKDIQDKYADVQKEVNTGVMMFNAQRLEKIVKETIKKEGKEEAAKCAVNTRITTPTGTRNVRTIASKTYPIPGKDTTCTKYAVVQDNIKETRAVDKDAVAKMEADMAKLFGI